MVDSPPSQQAERVRLRAIIQVTLYHLFSKMETFFGFLKKL